MKLDYFVVLLQVVPSAQELNILCNQRRAAARVRNVVVEVKIVLTPAHYALAFVSFPDFHFHSRRNESVVGQFTFLTRLCIDRIIARNKLEFEDLATATALFPGIEKFKESSVSPDTVANFLVYFDQFRRAFSPFRERRCLEEETILS